MMVGWFPSTIIHNNPSLFKFIPIKCFVTVERKVIGFTQRNVETHSYIPPLVFLPTSLSVCRPLQGYSPQKPTDCARLFLYSHGFCRWTFSMNVHMWQTCTGDVLILLSIREKSTCSLFYHSNPISRRVQGLPHPVHRDCGIWNSLTYNLAGLVTKHMCLVYARTVLDAWHWRITNKANFLISSTSVIFIFQGCVCASQKRTLCVLLFHSPISLRQGPHWICNPEILFHAPYSPGVLGSYAVTSGAATTLPLNLPNAATPQYSSSGVVTPTLWSSYLNLFPSSGITGGS